MQPANDNQPLPRISPLPLGVAPRGMNRTEGAAYMGVSPALFDQMVKDGRAPKPKMVNTRTVWDRVALDVAFDALPTKGQTNPWDDSYG